MKEFIKHFRRDPFGIWICVSSAELELPQGRIQCSTVGSGFAPGTKFMNVDLAALLEDHHEKNQGGRPDTADDA